MSLVNYVSEYCGPGMEDPLLICENKRRIIETAIDKLVEIKNNPDGFPPFLMNHVRVIFDYDAEEGRLLNSDGKIYGIRDIRYLKKQLKNLPK